MNVKREILSTQEKKNLVGYNAPSKKYGGALSSLYPTKKNGCGNKK
jgi:hypothetical protein